MAYFRDIGNFITFGSIDRSDANNIRKNTDDRKEDVLKELEETRALTHDDIGRLGLLKQQVYASSISHFVEAYQVVGKVDLKPVKESESLDYGIFEIDFCEMKVVALSIKEVSTAVAGGALVGTTAAFGAMGTVAIIGTASTGTAIGTLSGVAATNATLAWLGGGAISAGGAGMAGGMVVLGGIALAPVLVFGMFMGTNNGKQALNEAKKYSDQTDVLIEKVITLIEELSQIRRGCYLMCESIKALNALMQIYNIEMGKIAYRLKSRTALSKFLIDPIRSKLFNMSLLTDKEAEVFATSANIASLLTQIIKKPLINEDGAFVSQSLEELMRLEPQIKLLSNKKG